MTRRPTSTKRRRPHRCMIQPEFGDWRVPLDKPHEAEHLRTESPGVIRRMQVQAQNLMNTKPVYGAVDLSEWQPMTKGKRILRLSVGLLILLPLSVVMVYALLVQLYHAAPVVGNIDFLQSVPVWYSVLGALVFASLKYFRLVDAFLIYFYVLGHELTHALAALMCFGKVETVSVEMDGGYVETNVDNIFVALAPYFVPLWMLLWMAVLFVADWIVPFESYGAWFYAGFGFWWSFHVYWTMWVIPREQPDLLENGVVFSFLIIMLTNIAALLLVLRCFGVISLHGYWADFKSCAFDIYNFYADVLQYCLSLI